MQAMVMPLGQLRPSSYALFWLFSDGRIGLALGTSWPDAAEAATKKLAGVDVVCDPALATVARRFNWASRQPTPAQQLERAAVALGLAYELSPRHHDQTLAFVRAWLDFFPVRLWEQMPAEMALHTLLRRKDAVEEGCLAMLGQAGQEYGLAWYDDVRAFDAVWSGEHFPATGFSVLAHQDPFLAPAFQPFGVPPPLLIRVVKGKGTMPKPDTYRLATSVLELTLDVMRPEGPQVRDAGEGQTIELKREEPPRKKQPAPKKPKKTKKRTKR